MSRTNMTAPSVTKKRSLLVPLGATMISSSSCFWVSGVAWCLGDFLDMAVVDVHADPHLGSRSDLENGEGV
jgi:hypothetical protein